MVLRFPKLLSVGKDSYYFTSLNIPKMSFSTPVKKELQRLKRKGIITKVGNPTNWCAVIVVVSKDNQKVFSS